MLLSISDEHQQLHPTLSTQRAAIFLPGSFSGRKGILPQHAGVRRAGVPRTLLATDNLKQAQEGDLRLRIILLYKKNKMYQPDLGS